MEFCAEGELCVGNTYFEHKSGKGRRGRGKEHVRSGAGEEFKQLGCVLDESGTVLIRQNVVGS